MRKFILLLILLPCWANAGSSKALQELVTVGVRSLEGQNVLANIFTKPIPKDLGKEALAKSISEYSRTHYVLARLIEDPAAEEVGREVLVETLLGFSQNGNPVEKELLYQLSQNVKSDQLQELDLSGGGFKNIDLSGVTLEKVKFDDANLSGAVLSKAKLDGASFVNANLSGAKMLGINLSQVKLDGAKYDSATRLPLFFDPKAHKMISTGGKLHNKFTYLLMTNTTHAFLIQCGLGTPMGVGAAFGVEKLSSFDQMYWTSWGAGLVPMLINYGLIKKKSSLSIYARLYSAYSCGAVGGVITGLAI